MSENPNTLQSQVAQLEDRVTEIEQRLDGNDTLETSANIRDFVESWEPSSHTERALCLAYYLEKYRDTEVFTVEDIEDAYRECRVQPAGNMSDVLYRMEDREWLLKEGKDGQSQLWRLTADGLKKVEEGLDNDA